MIGLPLVLWHAGTINGDGAGLTLGGLALAALTAVLGVCVARARSDDDWGGGVSLLST